MKTRIQLIRELMARETDTEKIAELGTELEEAIRDEERAKLREEREAEAQKKAAEQSAAAEVRIEVKGGKTNLYTAAGGTKFDLAREMRMIERGYRVQNPQNRAYLQSRVKADPDMTMSIAKIFLDAFDAALAGPMTGAQIRAAMQEGDAAEGGYLVPTEQRAEIVAYAREQSIALQEATHIPMTSRVMTLPRELTNITAAFTAEENAATQSEPTFDQVTLTATRLDAFGLSSKELIEDAVVNGGLTGLLLDQFMEASGKKMDSAVFIGTGSPMSGIFTAAAGYSVVLGTGSTGFANFTYSSFMNAMSRVAEADATNMKWYVHRVPRLSNIMNILDTTGNPIFFSGVGTGGAEPPSILGAPFRSSTQMPSVSAVSTAMAVFGDLRGVYIGDRITTFEIMLDPYSRMEYHQLRYFFYTRWGFALALPKLFSRMVTAAA